MQNIFSNNNMISDELISFVVQGPIIKKGENTTKEVLKSIKLHFPKSEIVLSTWENEDINDLLYDKLVLSQLPNSIVLFTGHQCNVNRQIVSAVRGIEISTKKYVVKTRTDTLFENNNLLEKYKDNRTSSAFKQYVLTIDLFTRDSYKASQESFYDGFLYHPSDIFLIGLKIDILRLFSCKLAKVEGMFNRRGITSLVPEQYIWISFLNRKKKVNTFRKSIVAYNPKPCYKSERLLFENFKIFSCKSIGIKLPKRLINGWLSDCIITEEFQQKIDNKNELQKKLLYAKRAIYACYIYNLLYRKILKIKSYKLKEEIKN